jgi:cell filamentation protein
MATYTDEQGVFRNKFGITDVDQLRDVEYNFTANRSREILEKTALNYAHAFDLSYLCAIHRHLFQDIYEWAGKIRTVPARKRMETGIVSEFFSPNAIESAWHELEKRTQTFMLAKGWTFTQKCDALADIFIEANCIHPFPEGNGRSLQVFMQELAYKQGVTLDYSKIPSAQAWNRACAVSGKHGRLFEHMYLIEQKPDLEPIKKIFAEIACETRKIRKQRTR